MHECTKIILEKDLDEWGLVKAKTVWVPHGTICKVGETDLQRKCNVLSEREMKIIQMRMTIFTKTFKDDSIGLSLGDDNNDDDDN